MPSKLTPALVGGALIALFSSFPILKLGNCLCCLWVVSGGWIAAWLYRRSLPGKSEMTSSEGAVLGLLSGVYGALFSTFLYYLFANLSGTGPGGGFDGLNFLEDMPKEFTDSMDWIRSITEASPIAVSVRLLTLLLVDSIFATAGGMLFPVLIKKSKPKMKRAR